MLATKAGLIRVKKALKEADHTHSEREAPAARPRASEGPGRLRGAGRGRVPLGRRPAHLLVVGRLVLERNYKIYAARVGWQRVINGERDREITLRQTDSTPARWP